MSTRICQRVTGKVKAKIRRYKRLMAGEFDSSDAFGTLYTLEKIMSA